MNILKFIMVCTLIAGLSAGCKKDSVPENPVMKQVQLSEKQKQLIDGNNAFGFEFFRKVNTFSEGNSNLMVSPLSVSMALGMTRNGARGSTLEGMTQTLGFGSLTEPEINESYKYLLDAFISLDPKVKLYIANSIWYRNNFSVEPDFVATNQQYFNAIVRALDFNNPASKDIINSWVKDNTNQLIPGIVDQIPSDVVMYLINAVYFKGQWANQFEKSKTQLKPFYLSDGTGIQAQSMLQHASLLYSQETGFQAVELPYNQGNFTMTILLPDAGNTVNGVISQLSPENWKASTARLKNTDMQLQLPKFKYSYDEKQMIPILSDMGMALAFDPYNANFTGINKNGGLYISSVKHKTFIETNEEGSEAAAVTSVAIGETAVGPLPQPLFLKIDRPFVYFIQEKSTGTLLFIGIVLNPNK